MKSLQAQITLLFFLSSVSMASTVRRYDNSSADAQLCPRQFDSLKEYELFLSESTATIIKNNVRNRDDHAGSNFLGTVESLEIIQGTKYVVWGNATQRLVFRAVDKYLDIPETTTWSAFCDYEIIP